MNPDFVIMDFERAMINAASKAFPKAKVRTCLFHLAQSVLRELRSTKEMRELYKRDKSIKMQVRSLYALSFFNPAEIRKRFEYLLEKADPRLHSLYKYFENVSFWK